MLQEIDELKLYFKEDFVINEHVVIHQPTIGDIVSFGEQRYFSVVHSLCAIPSDMKSFLFDIGIDYTTISDYEFFLLLVRQLKREDTALLLGDLDFSKMELALNTKTQEHVLADWHTGNVIDQMIYLKMADYLRKMHHTVPKVEHAYNAFTKNYLIEEDRERITLQKDKPYASALLPLISSMVNSPGFKYNIEQLKDIGIVAFMDSVRRISVIKATEALMHGAYFADTSKIKKSEFNWLRDLGE